MLPAVSAGFAGCAGLGFSGFDAGAVLIGSSISKGGTSSGSGGSSKP